MFFYRILAAAVTILGVACMVSGTAAAVPEAKDVQADSETPSTLPSVFDLTKPHNFLGAV